MEGQRNDFMQGKTQDRSWGGAGGGGLYGALEARHAKINPDKEHNQPFPSTKWIKAVEFSC